MSARDKLILDHQLLALVEKHAGSHVHRLAQIRTIYQCAPDLHRAAPDGDDRWKYRFEEAEKQLRAHVAAACQDEFHASL